jgi:hypothetical protein
MLINQFARTTTAGAVIFAIGSIAALPASAASHRSHHHAPHRSHRASNAIPQHNGGDRDVDNNGAPSDGDGNV